MLYLKIFFKQVLRGINKSHFKVKYASWSIKNSFDFSLDFFASLGKARQNMEKLGSDTSSGPSKY